MNMIILVPIAVLLVPIIFQLYTKYFIKRTLNLVRKFDNYEYEFFLNIVFALNFFNRFNFQSVEYVEEIIESSVGFSIFSIFFILGLTGLINKERYKYNTRPIYLTFIFLFISFTLLSMLVNDSGSDGLIYFTFIGLSSLFFLLYGLYCPIGNLGTCGVELAQEISEKSIFRELADIYFFNIDEVIYRKKIILYFIHLLLFFTSGLVYFNKIDSLSDIINMSFVYVTLLIFSLILSFFMQKDFFRIYSVFFTAIILIFLNNIFISILTNLFLNNIKMNRSLFYLMVEPFIIGLFDLILTIYLTLNNYTEMSTYYVFYSTLMNLILRPGICGTVFLKNSIGFLTDLSKLAIPFINISVLLIPLSLEASKQTLSFELGFTLTFTYVLYLIIIFSQYYFYRGYPVQ